METRGVQKFANLENLGQPRPVTAEKRRERTQRGNQPTGKQGYQKIVAKKAENRRERKSTRIISDSNNRRSEGNGTLGRRGTLEPRKKGRKWEKKEEVSWRRCVERRRPRCQLERCTN